jgi:hypothetical protein
MVDRYQCFMNSHHNPENNNRFSHRHEKLKSRMFPLHLDIRLIAIVWLVLLRCIRGGPGSNLGPEIGYTNTGVR